MNCAARKFYTSKCTASPKSLRNTGVNACDTAVTLDAKFNGLKLANEKFS